MYGRPPTEFSPTPISGLPLARFHRSLIIHVSFMDGEFHGIRTTVLGSSGGEGFGSLSAFEAENLANSPKRFCFLSDGYGRVSAPNRCNALASDKESPVPITQGTEVLNLYRTQFHILRGFRLAPRQHVDVEIRSAEPLGPRISYSRNRGKEVLRRNSQIRNRLQIRKGLCFFRIIGGQTSEPSSVKAF